MKPMKSNVADNINRDHIKGVSTVFIKDILRKICTPIISTQCYFLLCKRPHFQNYAIFQLYYTVEASLKPSQ